MSIACSLGIKSNARIMHAQLDFMRRSIEGDLELFYTAVFRGIMKSLAVS